MTPEQWRDRLHQSVDKIERAVVRVIPVKAGQEAKNHFQDNFRKGGFVDGGLHPWKRSKRIGTAKGADGQYGTLLSSRRHLYSAINYKAEPRKVTITNNTPYARVHNEGLRAGRGKGFIMPKRQFIGESHELTKKVAHIIEDEINKALE